MKTPGKFEVKPFVGIDERIPAAPNSTILMENMTYDAHTKTWNNFLGFEEFFHKTNRPYTSATNTIYSDDSVDSIYCYQRHNSSQQWFLFEQGGSLKYLVPAAGQANNQVAQTLDGNRHIPTRNEAHTNYTPYGRYCVITNGVDGPLKYRGGDRLFPLGWDRRPGAPDAINPGVFTGGEDNPQAYIEASGDFELGQDELGGNIVLQSSVYEGVGFLTGSDGQNRYRYKCSFVNEAGSESPISEATPVLRWTTADITKGTNEYANRAVVAMEIPKGPTGTIARRMYRTANDGTDFFFLDLVANNTDDIYVDYKPDTQLGALAPNDSDSIIFPAAGGRFTATFKNTLFIDGGISDGSRLYYSNPLQPDTFRDSAFFEVGTREGGDITGFEVYYNALLVFREQAIDLVRGDPLNGFELVPFITGIGTKSPHCIINVPTKGIMFLGQDGVYRIFGGLDGGADLGIEKVSDPIQQYIERLSLDRLPSAVGIYSAKWREVHYYCSLDDGYRLDTGLVYHLDSDSWSTRTNREWSINCITTDKDANLIYGYWRTYDNDTRANRGIYVISRFKKTGTVSQGSGEEKVYLNGQPVVSKIRTQWLDLGYPFIKKHIKYVYLYCLTTGNGKPLVKFYKDRQWENGVTTSFPIMQRPDHAFQPVYTPVDDGLEDSEAVWDTAVWQDKLLTQIRLPVDLKAVSEFALEIETTEPLIIMGYTVEFTSKGMQTIRGREK